MIATSAAAKSVRHVQVAIIGAGTAGLNARRGVEYAGKTALLIDPGPFGTTCARVGCMPSKLLIAAADAAHHVSAAPTFGVETEPPRIDGVKVMARVRSERDRFAGFVVKSTEELLAAGKLLKGRARFTGPNTLEVTGDHPAIVHFDAAVVATGSAPFVPPPFRDLGDAMVDNAGVFDWYDLPKKLLVVGAGVIGMELGQALSRLGVGVTLVGVGGGIAGIQDAQVRAEAVRIFSEELDLHLNSPVRRAERLPDGRVRAWFTDRDGAERQEDYDQLLLAAGRRPATTTLDLGAAGVELDARGVPQALDPLTLQLGGAPIFLAGDVNNLHPLLHEASDDGRIAGQNAAHFPDVSVLPRRLPMGIVFTDPNIAFVGLHGAEVDPLRSCTGQVNYGNQGRARVMAVGRGLLRIHADRATRTLIGAEMVGPRMEHVAHLLAWAVQQQMTVEQAVAMPFYHPVIEEGVRTALKNLRRHLRTAAPVGEPCEGFAPGE
ncbi:MAG: dihydrolipoyl dehydrogenase [Myxococcales bacterium]|nr:dihydrolipoyl dehydrogenase [Myxococcales bacterium]